MLLCKEGTLTGGNTEYISLAFQYNRSKWRTSTSRYLKQDINHPGNKDVVVNIAVADIVINITAIEGVTPPVADETQ